ncbi:hypothetical protein FKM82_020599 [Ascaphus truei]
MGKLLPEFTCDIGRFRDASGAQGWRILCFFIYIYGLQVKRLLYKMHLIKFRM